MRFITRIIIALVNWSGYICTNVGMVFWMNALDKSNIRDVYIVLLQATFSALIFGTILNLFISYKYKNITKNKINHFRVAIVALLGAMFFLIAVYCSPPTRTPPFFQASSPMIEPVFVALIEFFAFKKSLSRYNNYKCYIAFTFIFIASCFSIYPIVKNQISDNENVKKIGWCMLSLTGLLCQNLQYVGQKWMTNSHTENTEIVEITIVTEYSTLIMNDKSNEKKNKLVNFVNISFWQLFYQFIFVLFFIWTDFIPNFGDAKTDKFLSNFANVMDASFNVAMWGKYNYAGLFSALFNFGFMFYFVAGLYLNNDSPFYNSIISVSTAFGATIIYYLIPSINAGVMTMPWFSIWLPIVFGAIGVILISVTISAKHTI